MQNNVIFGLQNVKVLNFVSKFMGSNWSIRGFFFNFSKKLYQNMRLDYTSSIYIIQPYFIGVYIHTLSFIPCHKSTRESIKTRYRGNDYGALAPLFVAAPRISINTRARGKRYSMSPEYVSTYIRIESIH